MKGHIRNLQSDKAYAFIRASTGLDNIFLHRDNYYGDWAVLHNEMWKDKVYVQFELEDGPKGPRAGKCVRITESEYNSKL